MAYDPTVVKDFLRAIGTTNASPRAAKALFEAGIVESGLQNLNHGDRDSLGPLQQRPSQGWANARDPYKGALDFLSQAMQLDKSGKYGTAGALAAAVQRPAAQFRGRYQGQSSAAQQLLGGSAATQAAGTGSATSGTTLDYGDQGSAVALLTALQGQQQRVPTSSIPLQAPSFAAGPKLPNGAGTIPTSGGPAPRPDISNLLAVAAAAAGSGGGVTQGQGSNGAQTGSNGLTDPISAAAGISPHAKPGDPVVSSRQSEGGLHQTDGLPGYPAHDYFAPAGTHAVAPVSGKVVKLSGHDPAQGPTNGPHGPLGWSVYIQGSDGKTYFLTHLGSRTNVKVGQTVKQGQIIGTVANYDKYGTPSHIHEGVHG